MKFRINRKSKVFTKLPFVFFVSFISFGYLAAGSLDEQAITKTLRNYIDGPNEKNIVKLKSAFAGSATIFYVRDSKLVEIRLEDFSGTWRQGGQILRSMQLWPGKFC